VFRQDLHTHSGAGLALIRHFEIGLLVRQMPRNYPILPWPSRLHRSPSSRLGTPRHFGHVCGHSDPRSEERGSTLLPICPTGSEYAAGLFAIGSLGHLGRINCRQARTVIRC